MAFDASKLSRVILKKNPKYVASGEKSYAYALHKYNIEPTLNGPFCMVDKTALTGAHQTVLDKLKRKISSKPTDKYLAKRDADGKPGLLSAEDIQNDALYLAEVEIGTPKEGTEKQILNLDFDTGSADLWCWSSFLPDNVVASAKGSGHAVFNPNNSSTWKPLEGESFEISYGDGSHASGTVGTDVVTVGGLQITGQGIETANDLSKQFQSGEGDGLLGLAFGKINTVSPTPVKTPVENMINEDIIPKGNRLFTAYLGSWRDKEDPDQGKSFYTFGFIDQEVVKSTGQEIHYVDVDNSQGFWQFPSATAMVNGQNIDLAGNTAIADTGTTLALVSDKVCKAVYDAIPGAFESSRIGGWVIPSDTSIQARPTVQFAVGDKLFSVEKEDLVFVDLGNGYAYGGIQSRGNLSFDILGDTFLKGLYAIFDQGNQKFGCVQRDDPTQSAALPPVDNNA